MSAPHQHDLELTLNDIQSLDSRDQLAAFFGKLGYPVVDTVINSPSTYGFDTDELQHQIVRAVLLANAGGDELVVLLIELRRVAEAITHQIAQKFRERSGSYLLVLMATPNPDETLDFVLLDRRSVESASASGIPRYAIHPRVLTMHRRNPGVVLLRVLKRFTFTEPDALYQWDKLRSAYLVAEWSEPECSAAVKLEGIRPEIREGSAVVPTLPARTGPV